MVYGTGATFQILGSNRFSSVRHLQAIQKWCDANLCDAVTVFELFIAMSYHVTYHVIGRYVIFKWLLMDNVQ